VVKCTEETHTHPYLLHFDTLLNEAVIYSQKSIMVVYQSSGVFIGIQDLDTRIMVPLLNDD
jgi:hypothetical protein